MKSKLIRDSLGSLLLRLIYIIFSFIMGVVMVRALGVMSWGVFSYTMSVIAILIIPAEFGLPILVIRETASNIAVQEWGKVKGLWIWARRTITILTSTIIIAGIIGILIFRRSFDQNYQTTFYLGLVLVFLLSFIHLQAAQLMGLKKIVLGQLAEQVLIPGLLILLVLVYSRFLKIEISPQQAMVLRIIAAAISLVVGIFIIKKFVPGDIKNTFPEKDGKAWLLSAIPLAGINGINRLNNESSLLILGLFANSSEIGLYKTALSFSILSSFALQVINTVVAPQFASMYSNGEMDRLQKLVRISARMAFFANIIITGILIIFGRQLLSFTYGQPFVGSYFPLIILLVGQCINSSVGSVGYLLNMTQKENFVIKGVTSATIINIVLTFALSPKFGMIGAAIGTSISMMVSNLYFWAVVRRQLGINTLIFRI
ncbi:MAG: oligosaccharide flippase family protein [Bacteroidales bacterium]|nr:oligosaccharide flippase family protein [Bacteroidales bacterium]